MGMTTAARETQTGRGIERAGARQRETQSAHERDCPNQNQIAVVCVRHRGALG